MPATPSITFDPKRYAYAPYTTRSKDQCPHCQAKDKSYSRWIDTYTGELLSSHFGFCDHGTNCGWNLKPNDILPGQKHSYAFEVHLAEQRGGTAALPTGYEPRQPVEKPIRTIPAELMQRTLGHYDQNQFARLLTSHLGGGHADELLARFRIGTSALYLPGACIFWYIDEKQRVRGGQLVAFGEDWHTLKRNGKRCTNWVHSCLEHRLTKEGKPLPPWLELYLDGGTPSPCLFGLWQLQSAAPNAPVYLTESVKSAVLAAAYMPDKVWMATGGQSYLTLARMGPLKGRRIILYPDSSLPAPPNDPTAAPKIDERTGLPKSKPRPAYDEWQARAEMLRGKGFDVRVSDFLQNRTTDEQKKSGYDLADYLVNEYAGFPPSWAADARVPAVAVAA